MRYIVSPMGFGDCLITLSLLEHFDLNESHCRVLGTGITQRVSALLNNPIPVTELLPDKAAFYFIKQYGPWVAFRDYISMRKSLAQLANAGDIFAFERNIVRNKTLRPFQCRNVYAPQTHHAYADRQALIRQLMGHAPNWIPTLRPKSAIRTVLINPCARFDDRWLAPEVLSNLVLIARERSWSLNIVDPCGHYSAFRYQVNGYFEKPPLAEAVAMLKATDLYIGPDSFFIHLAYYYRVPLFGFFFQDYHDFLVPGMEQLGNFTDFDSARDLRLLKQALMEFVEPDASHAA